MVYGTNEKDARLDSDMLGCAEREYNDNDNNNGLYSKVTIFFSSDDTSQSSVKTEHNVGVGWQTYLSSRRDIIVAAVQTNTGLDTLYSTLRSDNV